MELNIICDWVGERFMYVNRDCQEKILFKLK